MALCCLCGPDIEALACTANLSTSPSPTPAAIETGPLTLPFITCLNTSEFFTGPSHEILTFSSFQTLFVDLQHHCIHSRRIFACKTLADGAYFGLARIWRAVNWDPR